MGETRDHRGRPVVAVTGYGMISSLGQGVADSWAGLIAGRSGIKSISRFPTENMRTRIAGAIDYLWQDGDTAMDITMRAGILAAEEAIADAAIGSKGDFPGPLFAAMPPAEMEWPYRRRIFRDAPPAAGDAYDRMIGAARQHNDDDGYHHTLLGFIAEGIADQIGTQGRADLADHRLRLRRHRHPARRRGDPPRRHRRRHLARRRLFGEPGDDDPLRPACRRCRAPTSRRKACRGPSPRIATASSSPKAPPRWCWRTTMSARARGARIHAIVRGIGEKADDFHRTRSRPDGSAIIGAIRTTIEDAGLTPDAIEYINAHGTSTPENDKMEAMSLEAIIGERMKTVPISSNKSMIGHTLTAAGAIEAIFSIKTIEEGVLPPTINYHDAGPGDRLRRGAQRGAQCQRHHGAVELLRLRRPERLPADRRRAGLTGSDGFL